MANLCYLIIIIDANKNVEPLLVKILLPSIPKEKQKLVLLLNR
jgi:hypothetical protein